MDPNEYRQWADPPSAFILKELNAAECEDLACETTKEFAVIADEVQDFSKKEQLFLCLIRKQESGNERFVGYSDQCDHDAKALAEKIVVRLQVGLDVKQCIAQCYDGVSVMSSQVSGRLREVVGSGCVYIHCHAHRY